MGKTISLKIASGILFLVCIAAAILFYFMVLDVPGNIVNFTGVFAFIYILFFVTHLISSIGMFILKRWAIFIAILLSAIMLIVSIKYLLQNAPFFPPIGLIVYITIFWLSLYGLINNDSLKSKK